MQQNDLPAALQDVQETIQLEPPGSKLLAADHTERGRILHAQKKYEAAVKAYDLALRIDPDYAAAHHDRGGALMESAQYAEAIRAFDNYLRKGKPEPEIYEARGLARMKLKDLTGAIADFSRALEMEPKSARLYAYRGWTFLVDKAPTPALRDFEQAVQLDPKNADAYNGRGLAGVKLGRIRESIADADEALRLGRSVSRLEGPESIRMFYNAARIYAQAAGRIDVDARQANYRTAWTRYAYQDRAVDLLRQALDRLPAEKRAAFWRETIHSDDALEPIARSRAFVQLAAPYVKPVK